jgi:hypothetical protein
MNINLNSRCKVILTQYGADHYNRIHAFMGKNAPAEKTEGDRLEDPIWSLMHDFGEVCWHGNPSIPFRDMKIEVLN